MFLAEPGLVKHGIYSDVSTLYSHKQTPYLHHITIKYYY